MTAGRTCPSCGVAVTSQDAFCESCGQPLGGADPTPAPRPPADHSVGTHLIAPPSPEPSEPTQPIEPPAVCAQCGGAVGADGWCTVCGARGSNGREHVVAQPLPWVAGVSDIGVVHARNEDALALDARPGWAALVVCDGVTTATDSDVAADAAVRAAIAVLSAAPAAPASSPAVRIDHWADQLSAAARSADAAADAAAGGTVDNPPSCTFVAAVVDDDVVVCGWVGDSRAYWLPDGGPAQQLSVDDSWASAQIAAGVDRAVAEAGPRAHAITKWLGADSPDVDRVDRDDDGDRRRLVARLQ